MHNQQPKSRRYTPRRGRTPQSSPTDEQKIVGRRVGAAGVGDREGCRCSRHNRARAIDHPVARALRHTGPGTRPKRILELEGQGAASTTTPRLTGRSYAMPGRADSLSDCRERACTSIGGSPSGGGTSRSDSSCRRRSTGSWSLTAPSVRTRDTEPRHALLRSRSGRARHLAWADRPPLGRGPTALLASRG